MEFLRTVEGGCRTDQLRNKLHIFPLRGKFTKCRDNWKIYSQEGWTEFALLFKLTGIARLVGTQEDTYWRPKRVIRLIHEVMMFCMFCFTRSSYSMYSLHTSCVHKTSTTLQQLPYLRIVVKVRLTD
jgi:hypothetical protein